MDPTVEVFSLITTLRENREKHRAIFLEAQKVYRAQMIEEYDRRAQEARDGKKIRRSFSQPVPEDHTDDFDTAIEMLQWETRERVTLTQREFQRYVQNRWEWDQSFHANTVAYSQQLDAES